MGLLTGTKDKGLGGETGGFGGGLPLQTAKRPQVLNNIQAEPFGRKTFFFFFFLGAVPVFSVPGSLMLSGCRVPLWPTQE